MAVGQLALLSAAIYAAVVCVEQYWKLSQVDIGFDPVGVWTQPLPQREVPIGLSREELLVLGNRQLALVTSAIERIKQISGVQAVAAGEWPLGRSAMSTTLVKMPGVDDYFTARLIRVSAEFFSVLRVPVPAGEESIQTIVDETRARAARPVVHRTLGSVGEQEPPPKVFVSTFPRLAPAELIGKSLEMAVTGPVTVVGIAPTLRLVGPKEEAEPAIWSFSGHGDADNLLVRLSTNEESVRNEVRRSIEDTWSGATVHEAVPVTRWLDQVLQDEFAAATILSLLVLFSAPISILGLTGWTSHWLETERRDAVIRIALGASATAVRRGLLARFVPIVSSGFALGGFVIWWLAGLTASLRLEAPSLNVKAMVFVLAAGLIAVLISSVRPLVMISRVSPAETLKVL